MKSITRDGVLRGGYATGTRLLLIAAAGISGYLLSVSLSGGRAVGCGPGFANDPSPIELSLEIAHGLQLDIAPLHAQGQQWRLFNRATELSY